MTPEEFRAFLDIYGSDLTKWPAGRRLAAERLLKTSDSTIDIFAEACAFEGLLRQPAPPLATARRAALVDSIMDRLDPPAEPASKPPPLPRLVVSAFPAAAPRKPAPVLREPWTLGLDRLFLPMPGLMAGCAMAGLLIGVGLGQMTAGGALPFMPAIYGGIDLWLH
ncbi:hypothetical protein CKO38_02250 [Rhodospirillum rubrum]|uniref:hypothetical protein n=1 Tax=Rhodospirillum rubrum TaxID=1085 RepID=UPI001902D26B|nr:hypothetical protein [Rhodospirillum rubrum]MBK1665060.1 hypothetical protein [Rhodospirillum rubrum]MBK1675513.1 hypothetical protein [Rhodospirillum rubrum]